MDDLKTTAGNAAAVAILGLIAIMIFAKPVIGAFVAFCRAMGAN